ncbi:hypothetical protein JTB14_010411 [Gonioctena quinquepunctata]|nr:hypothetical protein JTB14_010411 [Gonioctena quinquepunctata]
MSQIQPVPVQDTRQDSMISPNFSDLMLAQPVETFVSQTSPYSTVISKNNTKTSKNMPASHSKMQNMAYSKSLDNIYPSYSQQNIASQVVDRICMTDASQVNQPQSTQQQQEQELQQQIQDLQRYKLVSMPQQDTKPGYKLSMVTSPSIKFTSSQNDVKPEPRRRGAPHGKGRSRSNTREPIKRPPLISALSDPSLITPQNSLMLTQLLTNHAENSSSSLFAQNHNQSQSTQDSIQMQIKTETNSAPILPQPPPMVMPAVNISSPQCSTPDSINLGSYSNSNSPITDPLSQSIHSPTSSQSSIGSPSTESSCQRDRRVVHIHAEQKRRYNIKNGFDMLHSLIPQLNQNPNAKLSKAALLQKGADYIIQLRAERNQLKDEMDSLRQQIESLNTSISNCQSLLPATGAPVSRRRDSKMQEMFDEYVRNRTMENWKFWIFSLIFKPLLNSFNNFVSSSSLDDLYSSTMLWIEQHCTLVDLRPVVLNSLRYLCTKTEILSEPEKLPEEARQIVIQANQNN